MCSTTSIARITSNGWIPCADFFQAWRKNLYATAFRKRHGFVRGLDAKLLPAFAKVIQHRAVKTADIQNARSRRVEL